MNRTYLAAWLLILMFAASGCAAAVLSGAATGSKDYPADNQDARITREARTAIYRDALLADEAISVSTSQGVVSLRGVVDNRAQLSRAVELVNAVTGVRGINLELEIKASP